MKIIEYDTYFDKVYGCFLGKCIAGTIGAPYEGMKELLEIKYSPILTQLMLPNDDLDLQVLWLEVLEKRGTSFISNDLAEAFLNKCPYSPAEYRVFKKNYRRGIYPPVSGQFNNAYYMEGMGCPIRSEIWACIVPGDMTLAAELSAKDGMLDHYGNSIYAEQFLAGVEAGAFFEGNLEVLMEKGFKLIPKNSKIVCLITDVLKWCRENHDWKNVRSRIIQKYGHPDCTNLFQNIGFTILALYFGKMNFIDTSMIALNCGYDTDCTCATVGSVLGIILGAKLLEEKYGFKDVGYILGVDTTRRSDRIYDLAEDICNVGVYFTHEKNTEVTINNVGKNLFKPKEFIGPELLDFSVKYGGIPAIGIGEEKTVEINITNNSCEDINGSLKILTPKGWMAEYKKGFHIESKGKYSMQASFSVPFDMEILEETNIITLETAINSSTATFSFGIAGAAVWRVFGPFWENVVSIPPIGAGDNYTDYIIGENEENKLDLLRDYHLNTKCDFERDYLKIDHLTKTTETEEGFDIAREGRNVNIHEDKFSVNDMIGFQGPCLIYMTRCLISPEERDAGILIGHTDAFELWINGTFVSKRNNVDWWTFENVHIINTHFKKGENIIALKLARHSEKADFSIVFLEKEGGMMGTLALPECFTDFASRNI